MSHSKFPLAAVLNIVMYIFPYFSQFIPLSPLTVFTSLFSMSAIPAADFLVVCVIFHTANTQALITIQKNNQNNLDL